MIKKIMFFSVLGLLSASVGFLQGCITVKGVGKDVSNGGKEIERAAS